MKNCGEEGQKEEDKKEAGASALDINIVYCGYTNWVSISKEKEEEEESLRNIVKREDRDSLKTELPTRVFRLGYCLTRRGRGGDTKSLLYRNMEKRNVPEYIYCQTREVQLLRVVTM